MARDSYQVEVDADVADAQKRAEGLTGGLVIVTTLLLLGAIIVMQQALKFHYDESWFGDAPTKGAPAE